MWMQTRIAYMIPSYFSGKGKWIVVLIVCLCSAQNGLFYSWPPIALRYILNGDAGFTITEQDHANILNAFLVSKIVGVFIVSFCMDRFGRKWTLFGASLLAVFGWFALFIGSNVLWLMISRVCCGLYVSVQLSLVPVIIGETMEPDMRGTMSSLSVFCAIALNLLASLCLSVGYTWFNVITGLPCLLILVASSFMVETPYYFLKRGEKENARKTILWLRGYSSEKDLNCMEEHIKSSSKKSGIFTSLLQKGSRRAFIIVIPLLITVTVASMELPLTYFFIIIPSNPIPAEISFTICFFVSIVSSSVSTFGVGRLGRRLITSVAFLGMAISYLALAIWYFNEDLAVHLGWFPPVALWFASFFFYFALETFPRLMLSELFSLEVKGVASVAVTTIKAAVTIILNQSFYPIRNNIGVWFYFAFAGSFLGLGVVLTYFLLPETKGQSLERIQDILTNGGNFEKEVETDNKMVSCSTSL